MLLHTIWILCKLYMVCAWMCTCIIYGNLSTMYEYNGKFISIKSFLLISIISMFGWFPIFIRNPYVYYKVKGITYKESFLLQISVIAIFLDTIFD